MMRARRDRGFWQSVRELPERTPLRVKLISAVLALVVLALAVISVAGISYIRDYLVNRADGELQVLQTGPNNGYGGRSPSSLGPSVGERKFIMAISSSGQVIPAQGYPRSAADPSVPTSSSWLLAHAGKPVTLRAEAGEDRWRVLVEPGQQLELTTGSTITGHSGSRDRYH